MDEENNMYDDMAEDEIKNQGYSYEEQLESLFDDDMQSEYDANEYEDNKNAEVSSESDGNSDKEESTQTEINIKPPRRRELTKLAKTRSNFVYYDCKGKCVKVDRCRRLKGKYMSEFPSFLGDLVRERVGLSVTGWKKVSKEFKYKL